MIYKIRPGIVRLRICDVDLLAATRQVWEQCPAVRPLPRIWAACWALMENGSTSEEAVDTFVRLFRQSEEEVHAKLGNVFETLYSEGYLIEAEDTQ